MKKTDIALIIVIAAVSIMVSYFVLQALGLGNADNKAVKVKTAEPISATVDEPDAKIFNKDAINPTVESIIGTGTGQ